MTDCALGQCNAADVMIRMAALEADLAALKAKQEATHGWVRDIDGKVDRLLEMASATRGGFRAMLTIGGLVSAFAAVGSWLYDHISGMIK